MNFCFRKNFIQNYIENICELQENVFNFDVPVSDWRLLIVHMKNASAQVLQYMDHLLLVEASWTEFN